MRNRSRVIDNVQTILFAIAGLLLVAAGAWVMWFAYNVVIALKCALGG